MFPELVSLAPPTGEEVAMGKLTGALSQVAPGVWASGKPAFETPSHVLCKLVPAEGGLFSLEPLPYPGYVRLKDDFGKKIGMHGLSSTTLRRLLSGGFVEHTRPGPDTIFVNIESLLAHLDNTADDCAQEKSFWTEKRREAWRKSYETLNDSL